MKRVLIVTITFLLIVSISFSQNKSKISKDNAIVDTGAVVEKIVPITNRSILLDNNVTFGNFSFNKKWNDIKSMFYFSSNDELEKYSFEQNNDEIYLSYNLNKEFEKLKFDDIFLKISKLNYINNGCSELICIKNFEKLDDAVNFYLNTSKIFFKINPNELQTEYFNFGKNINISVRLENNIVYLGIQDKWKTYNNSLSFSYDYYHLDYQFKEIDNDYSFREIKFGTNLSIIKAITKLDNYKFGNKFTFLPKDEKYLFWKGFEVPKGGSFFYFTKDYKLAEVSLAVDCFNDYGLNEIKNKLIDFFGPPSFKSDETIKWVGKNITISIPNKKGEKDYIHILISSNYLSREYDKDY